MEELKCFHKNALGAVTARLTLRWDDESARVPFVERHRREVKRIFDEAAVPMADAAYTGKALKKPLFYEVLYRSEGGKKPYIFVCERVSMGHEVICERQERHRFLSFGGKLVYRGGKIISATNKKNIIT